MAVLCFGVVKRGKDKHGTDWISRCMLVVSTLSIPRDSNWGVNGVWVMGGAAQFSPPPLHLIFSFSKL